MRRASTPLPLLALLACAAPVASGPTSSARGDPPPGPAPQAACLAAAPEALAVPGGAPLRLALGAEGVQIYTCAGSGAGYAWSFTAPEATLLDERGAAAGQHGAGPTWTLADGSRVIGQKEAAATPDATAIPWLLLRVTAHSGAGRLEGVSWVRRVATSGGLAPAAGCDASAAGTVARVSYRAAYCFHGTAPP